MTAKKIWESEIDRALRRSAKFERKNQAAVAARQEKIQEFLASKVKEQPEIVLPETPALLKPHRQETTGYISVLIKCAEIDVTLNFAVKNMNGSLFGRMRTEEGLRDMVKEALQTKLGRME